MRPRSRKTSLVLRLAGQSAMGSGLGALLALILLIADTRRMFAAIVASSEPYFTVAVFVGSLAASFAVGATLTGLIFIMMDEE